MRKKTWRTLVHAPTAAACLLFGATAQSSVYYDSNFDPPLPAFGFSGTARFQLADSCLTTTGFQYVNTSSSSCTVSMLSAMVHLFTPTSGPPTSTATLDFAPLLPDSLDIWGIDVNANHQLSGVDSFPVGPVSTAVAPFAGNWWMQYDDGLGHAPPGTFSTFSISERDPVNLYQGCVNNLPNASCLVGSAPNVTFQQVFIPEPGTLSLIFGALGGGWLARRRKKPT